MGHQGLTLSLSGRSTDPGQADIPGTCRRISSGALKMPLIAPGIPPRSACAPEPAVKYNIAIAEETNDRLR